MNMDPIKRKETLRIAELLHARMSVEEFRNGFLGGKHAKDTHEI